MAMRDWFIKDLGWKFFSLFLAVAIWLTIYKIRGKSGAIIASETLTFTNVPVHIVSSGADVRAFHVTPPNVAVTVSGSGDPIANLQTSEIRAYVDVESAAPAPGVDRQVDVSVPAGITPVRVFPEKVEVAAPLPTH